jgi:hypothetical protein
MVLTKTTIYIERSVAAVAVVVAVAVADKRLDVFAVSATE